MSNGPVFESAPGWGTRLGGWLRENWIYVLPAAAVIALIIVLSSANGDNNIQTANILNENEEELQATTTPLPAGSIAETVQPRDNYTLVARRLVTQMVSSDTDATRGQRLYAETILQMELQSQPLVSEVNIVAERSRVQEILNAYGSLTDYQRTRWESMAVRVAF
jgi:hypothetical protein